MRNRQWRDGGAGYGMLSPPPMTPVVKVLLLANVAAYVLDVLTPWSPALTLGLVPADVFDRLRVWQLGTYMFLHGGVFHLLFNMLMLWMFGTAIESAWGSREFGIYYAVCGVGAGLTTWATSPHSLAVTIGASGAVLGVLLAYGMMWPNREVLLYFLFPIKVKYLVAILVGIDLLAGLSQAQDGVAHFAHVGGMAFGWVYIKHEWLLRKLGIGTLTRRARGVRARQVMAQHARRAEAQQQQTRSVDEILDKISEQGIESLTEHERRILREASRH